MARAGLVLATLFLVGLWISPASAAGTLRVEYQVTGGSFITPPGAAITGGMYAVEFQALGRSTIVSGPAILKSLSFSGFDTYLTYGDVISTNFTLQLNGEAAGNGTVGSGFRNVASASALGPLALHCSGATCPSGGFVPSVSQFSSLIANAPASGIHINGNNVALSGTYQIVGVTSGFFSISLTGQEVSRVFMAEPQGTWMGLVAIICFAGVGAWSRRPSRAPMGR
jgi:hypothetical protein